MAHDPTALVQDEIKPVHAKPPAVGGPLIYLKHCLLRKDNTLKLVDPPDVKQFESLVGEAASGSVGIDPRTEIFQKGFKFAAENPGSDYTTRINIAAVKLLHSTKKYARLLAAADPSRPHRHPYARMVDVASTRRQPDAERVFNDLLRTRKMDSPREEHAAGVSGLVYALACITSLCLSRPEPGSSAFNETSPYLDLSPLYGPKKSNEGELRKMDGRGMLHPDCYFEDRVWLLTPAAKVLLVLWNRNHNFIAERLLFLNEKKLWNDPLHITAVSQKEQQDNHIFQIARTINCAQFRNVVMEDLVKGLLGLPHVGNSSHLNLQDLKVTDTGEVRPSSVEATLLYHWPALMSDADEDHFERLLGQAPTQGATQNHNQRGSSAHDSHQANDFSATATKLAQLQEKSASHRKMPEIEEISRDQSTGRFKDHDLGNILKSATKTAACMPGPRTVPDCHRGIEVLNLLQAREWNVCTLNQYREFLGLKRFKDFREWNPSQEIVDAANSLYGTIDELELYPGLLAEKHLEGHGFNLGFTMTFALLVDLVTVVRSDIHLAKDLALVLDVTKWGHGECTPELDNGAFGAALPKIILRTLPKEYPFDNIYALFPLTTPTMVQTSLNTQKLDHLYDCNEPLIPERYTVWTKNAISYVFNNPEKYPAPYARDLKLLTNGYGYMLGFDNETHHDADQMMTLYALMPDVRSFTEYAAFFGEVTEELIMKNSKIIAGDLKSIDIIADVINPACTRWVCETICGLKDTNDAAKLANYFQKFATLYSFVFRKSSAQEGWGTRASALQISKEMTKHIEDQLQAISQPPPTILEAICAYLTRIWKEFYGGHTLGSPSAKTFLSRLQKTSKTVGKFRQIIALEELKPLATTLKDRNELEKRRIIANVLGLSVVASVNYAQTCAQAVNFYLKPEHSQELAAIRTHCGHSSPEKFEKLTPENREKLMGYIREAQRLDQPFCLFRDVAVEEDLIPNGTDLIPVKKGGRICANFGELHRQPKKIDPDRKTHSIQGMGLHKCPGISFIDNTMPEMFRTIISLTNIRPSDGPEGRMELLANSGSDPAEPRIWIHDGEMTPYPKSLKLQYNGSPAQRKKWKVSPTAPSLARKIVDWLSIAMTVISTLWKIYAFFTTDTFSSSVALGPRVIRDGTVCRSPTTVFQKWDINTILPGPDGQPSPIEYTMEHKKPHRLSVVDIDARDMQLGVYVDGIMRGQTTDFLLDKSVNCGEDVKTCLNQNFSGGVVVVPPGKHTVKIAWVGKEFLPGTEDIDWGNEYSRRLKWQLEYCF